MFSAVIAIVSQRAAWVVGQTSPIQPTLLAESELVVG